jgi:hypothetical protein
MEPSLPQTIPPVPDLLAPVHAFRDWRITPEGLTSPRTGVAWTSPVLAASCHPRTAEDFVRPPHRAPGHGCTCGIHAYFRPGYQTSKVDYSGVTGIVTVWGQAEVHADGLRAEFARVEALGMYSRWTRRQKAAVSAVAEELDADLVDLYELEAAAERYATPVPPALVPAPQKLRRRPGHARVAPPAARVVIFGY